MIYAENTRSGRYFDERSDPELPPNRLYVHADLLLISNPPVVYRDGS